MCYKCHGPLTCRLVAGFVTAHVLAFDALAQVEQLPLLLRTLRAQLLLHAQQVVPEMNPGQ